MKAVWIAIAGFVRRNLLNILFLILILLQAMTWQAVSSLERIVDHYSCGTYSYPCRVVVQPDR
jgi:hypothetical protein